MHGTLKSTLRACERLLISGALESTRGDVRAASGILGLPERTLWSRLTRLELNPGRFRATQNVADGYPATPRHYCNHAEIADQLCRKLQTWAREGP